MSKKIIGVVSSAAAHKTIVVKLVKRETHPLYGKQYTVSRTYMAHDEKEQAKLGDTVEISECRPISKRKSWTLVRIVGTGHDLVELKEETI